MTDPTLDPTSHPTHNPTPIQSSNDADWASMFTLEPTLSLDSDAHDVSGTRGGTSYASDPSAVLNRNLQALQRGSPRAVEAIRSALPDPLLAFDTAPDGGLTATIADATTGKGVSLASKRRPLSEGARIAESAQVAEHGLVVVLGFGVGHHVEALARAMKTSGLVVVFEPDVGLLRAVLERVDCSGWLSSANVALLTDADDPVAMSGVLDGLEGVVGLGVQVIDHAPSLARLGDRAERFRVRLRRAISDVRTTLVTTLAMSETTARNLLMNADRYATGAGVNDLSGAAAGKPAIVVSAGPSLARNVEQLADPSVRERFVIIAVQTVLKTLLARGIRPHFVTAIDYHEISTRFYEGLTPDDVSGVRLVAEPKANPAILDAFPGDVVVMGSEALREFVPEAMLPDRGELPAGATVAHTAYDLARALGCDPVIFVGQDLGFTDGQYYAQGAAIHGVWASELSAFNTLEMMEWQRIARSKSLLHKRLDQNGRAIYLDEQMAAYLGQFERQFERDRTHGLRIIDATEGGVAKHGSEAMSFRDAIDRFALDPVGEMPTKPELHGMERAAVLARLATAMTSGQREAERIERLCAETASLLRELEHVWERVRERNSLIDRVHACRAEVQSLQAGWRLTRFLDQSGTLERLRADRKIDLAAPTDAGTVQRRRVARDLRNVEGLGRAAARASFLYARARDAVLGHAPKLVRDPSLDPGARGQAGVVAQAENQAAMQAATPLGRDAARSSHRLRVAGVVIADFARGALGNVRAEGGALDEGIERGSYERAPLWWTVARLSHAMQLDEIVVLTDDPPRAQRVVDAIPASRVQVRVERLVRSDADCERRASVGRARLWSRLCWRGGIGGMTVYDEALEPGPIARWLRSHDEHNGAKVDAIVACGGDWVAIDPAVVDAVVERHRELGAQQRVCFSPAPPGLGALVIDRGLVCDLADATDAGGRSPLATLGGALGYVPVAPRFDPLASPACLPITPRVRDAGVRAIADDGPSARAWCTALARSGLDADSNAVLNELSLAVDSHSRITLVVATTPDAVGWSSSSRATGWARARLGCPTDEVLGVMAPADAADALGGLVTPGSAVSVTIDAVGDPFAVPGIEDIIAAVRELGAGVHVRTPLLADRACDLAALCDVVSVDVLAGDATRYADLTGATEYNAVIERIERLSRGAMHKGVLPATWIVPRVTRCDAVLDQIEGLYDGSLTACGWCVIDALPVAEADERLRALVPVAWARATNAGVLLHPDGSRHASVFERADVLPAGRSASVIEARGVISSVVGSAVTDGAAA